MSYRPTFLVRYRKLHLVSINHGNVDGDLQLHAEMPSLARQKEKQKFLLSDALLRPDNLYVLGFDAQQNFVCRLQHLVLNVAKGIGKGFASRITFALNEN